MRPRAIVLVPSRPAGELARAVRNAGAIGGSVLAVVLEAEEPWWRPQLVGGPADGVLIQPFERGSGIALLAAVLRVFGEDPAARIVALRSPDADHLAAARAACDHLDRDAIVRLTPAGRSPPTLVASAGALVHLYHRAHPSLLGAFLRDASHTSIGSAGSLDHLYPWLPELDLDRDVLPFLSTIRTNSAVGPFDLELEHR